MIRAERPLNLALFTDSLIPSGVGNVMAMVARHLPPSRYRLHFVCADDSGTDNLAEQMRPYAAQTARVTLRGDDDLAALPVLAQTLRDWRIDIFHNHIGATWEGEWGTIAARCAEVPVVVATDHVPCLLLREEEREHRRRINRLLRRSYAVSESVRQSLIDAALVGEADIFTLENGVETPTALPSRAAARRSLGLRENERVALLLGRLTEQKDPAVLLRAAQLLAQDDFPVRVLIAGDGWLRAELEQETQRLGISGQVRFLGHSDDVCCLLAAADVLAMPSQFEGLPLAALEAMAVGLPVVGCDAPGVREAVAHGVTGWLAPIGDHACFAQGLHRAFQAETNRKWGQAAQARQQEQFTAKQMAERHDRAYRQVWADFSSRSD